VRGRRIAIAFAAVVLVVALYFVGTHLVAATLARQLSARFGTAVRTGRLVWNPLGGRWTLHGLRVRGTAWRTPPSSPGGSMRRSISGTCLNGRYRVRTLTLAGARLRLRATESGWELPVGPCRRPNRRPAPRSRSIGSPRRTPSSG
jgi:hypothetical protein